MTTTRYRSRGAILSTLALAIGGVVIGATPAQAATFNVTDDGDSSAVGTLRWAITEANNTPGPDTITISLMGSIPVGATSLPTITEDLTVLGPGSGYLTVHAVDSAFETAAAVNLNISGLSIVASHSAVRVLGGGDLTLDDVATTGSGESGIMYLATRASDDVNLTRVTVDGQYSSGSGSGIGNGIWIEMHGGTATLTEATANDMSSNGILLATTAPSTLVLTNLTANGNREYGIGAFLNGGLGSLSGATANQNGVSGFGDGGIVLIPTAAGEFIAENLSADQNGGYGIYAGVTDTAELTITGMTATNNADTGLWVQSDATATGISVSAATVTGNSEGGVMVGDSGVPYEGSFALRDSVVSDNTAVAGLAGGVEAYLTGATASLLIDRTTISDNDGVFGGIAVMGLEGFTNRITSSTLSGNTGQFLGGYTAIVGDDKPFAIDIVNSTISGNAAPVGAIGVVRSGPAPVDQTMTIANSTIVDNPSAPGAPGIAISGTIVAISNSILAGSGGSADLLVDDPQVTIEHSLVQQSDPSVDAAIAAGAGNLTAKAPGLGPLADNGGPTLTHLPNGDSPVVNAGNPAFTGLTTDQRGQARVIGILDMGSVEIVPLLAATGAETTVPLTGSALLLMAGILLVLLTRRARKITSS